MVLVVSGEEWGPPSQGDPTTSSVGSALPVEGGVGEGVWPGNWGGFPGEVPSRAASHSAVRGGGEVGGACTGVGVRVSRTNEVSEGVWL